MKPKNQIRPFSNWCTDGSLLRKPHQFPVFQFVLATNPKLMLIQRFRSFSFHLDIPWSIVISWIVKLESPLSWILFPRDLMPIKSIRLFKYYSMILRSKLMWISFNSLIRLRFWSKFENVYPQRHHRCIPKIRVDILWYIYPEKGFRVMMALAPRWCTHKMHIVGAPTWC